MNDPLDPHRDAVRAHHRRVTPWLLGVEVGRRGESHASPYPAGSRGDAQYRNGMRYGRIPLKVSGTVVRGSAESAA